MPGFRSLRHLLVPRRLGAAAAIVAAVTTIGAASASALSSSGSKYVVRWGDTVWGIAASHHSTAAAVAAANHLSPPFVIRPGQRLVIPPPASGRSALAGREPAIALAAHPDVASSLARAARQTGVPAALLDALAWQESGWQNGVVSATGARGVGQVEPSTVVFVNKVLGAGNLDPRVAADNVRISATFLAWLLAGAHGNQRLAVADYYQGTGSVEHHGVSPDTARYVDDVMALASRFQAAGAG